MPENVVSLAEKNIESRIRRAKISNDRGSIRDKMRVKIGDAREAKGKITFLIVIIRQIISRAEKSPKKFA
jgi:hypothetical protein